MQGKHFLIVYDIKDLKRLRKVAICMESYAIRVQKSVFETCADEKTIETLKRRLEKIIDKESDFVLIFELCERDFCKREAFGVAVKNDFVDKYQIL